MANNRSGPGLVLLNFQECSSLSESKADPTLFGQFVLGFSHANSLNKQTVINIGIYKLPYASKSNKLSRLELLAESYDLCESPLAAALHRSHCFLLFC